MTFHKHEGNIVTARPELRTHRWLAWRHTMPIGKVEHCGGKQHTSGGESDTARPNPRLVIGPAPHKGHSVNWAVQPGAILEVVVKERIDDGERGHQPDQVMVLFITSQQGFRAAMTCRWLFFLLIWERLNVGRRI